MRNAACCTVILVLLAAPLEAAPRPRPAARRAAAPHALPVPALRVHRPFYRDKWWWMGRAVSALAIVVDAASTTRAQAACGGCADSFPLWSVRGTGGLAGAGVLNFAVSTAFSIAEYELTANDPARGFRVAGILAQPVTDVALHDLWAARHNYALAAACRQSKLAC
jgi:hypothetical protein